MQGTRYRTLEIPLPVVFGMEWILVQTVTVFHSGTTTCYGGCGFSLDSANQDSVHGDDPAISLFGTKVKDINLDVIRE